MTEHELIKHIKAGQPDAFHHLVTQHQHKETTLSSVESLLYYKSQQARATLGFAEAELETC